MRRCCFVNYRDMCFATRRWRPAAEVLYETDIPTVRAAMGLLEN
jgi:hypothetical protein